MTLAAASIGPAASAAPRRIPLRGIALAAPRAVLPAPAVRAGSAAVIIALFPSELSPTHTTVESVLDRLAGHPSLALGMASATQAIYDPAQALLDISQGARIQMDRYSPQTPPELDLDVASHGPSAIGGWPLALARAATAPSSAQPGLLAGSVPGGAAFVGIIGGPYAGDPEGRRLLSQPAVAPSRRDHRGRPLGYGRLPCRSARRARSSAGPNAPSRSAGSSSSSSRAATAGDAQLGDLLAARRPGQLVVALESPPELHGSQTLWLGIAGDGAGGTLTSGSTHVRGMVEATDITATVLAHLGLPIPDQVQGQPITAGGARDPASLKAFRGADRRRQRPPAAVARDLPPRLGRPDPRARHPRATAGVADRPASRRARRALDPKRRPSDRGARPRPAGRARHAGRPGRSSSAWSPTG